MVVPRELNLPYKNNAVTCPTDKMTNIENNSQFPNLSNPDKPNENAVSVVAEHDVDKNNLYPNTTTERLETTSILADSIAECDPRDAVVIMSAALSGLSSGGPLPIFENAQSDASFWADLAAPFEIEAYFNATLERLKNLAMGIKSRKRVFLSLWESFSEADRMAFIEKVDPNGKFVGRAN